MKNRPLVAVLGNGTCQPGDEVYEKAYEFGKRLAEEGFNVINGGYSGVMEASAKGVAEAKVPEAEAIGIVMLCKHQGNAFLTKTKVAGDFFARFRVLMTEPDAYIFFPGHGGTAFELFVSTHIRGQWLTLDQRRPTYLICSGEEWDDYVAAFQTLTGQNMELLASVSSKVEIIIESLKKARDEGEM